MKRVLYTINEVETGDIYAWTEDKRLAEVFIASRKPGYFKLVKAEPKIPPYCESEDYANWQFSLFENQYKGSQIMMNVLGKGGDLFQFPTTYNENQQLETRCNKAYDQLLTLEEELSTFPLSDDVRKAVDTMIKYRKKKKNKMVTFDSFALFVELFGDTML